MRAACEVISFAERQDILSRAQVLHEVRYKAFRLVLVYI